MINMGLAICLASQLLWDFLSSPSKPQPPCARIAGKQPHQLSSYVGSRDLNSCLHVYLASALPAAPSLNPGHAFLLLVMCVRVALCGGQDNFQELLPSFCHGFQ